MGSWSGLADVVSAGLLAPNASSIKIKKTSAQSPMQTFVARDFDEKNLAIF